MTNSTDTSTARVERVCAAFAVDLQHSCDVANAVDLLRALAGERDQVKAELAEARNAALEEAAAICDKDNYRRLRQREEVIDDDLQKERFRVAAQNSRILRDAIKALSTNKETDT